MILAQNQIDTLAIAASCAIRTFDTTRTTMVRVVGRVHTSIVAASVTTAITPTLLGTWWTQLACTVVATLTCATFIATCTTVIGIVFDVDTLVVTAI
jgi:hypothetical protein